MNFLANPMNLEQEKQNTTLSAASLLLNLILNSGEIQNGET